VVGSVSLLVLVCAEMRVLVPAVGAVAVPLHRRRLRLQTSCMLMNQLDESADETREALQILEHVVEMISME